MIQSSVKASNSSRSTLLLDKLPEIGEMINISQYGPAMVEKIFHNGNSNLIQVQYQETDIGPFSATYNLEVKI